MDSTNKEVANEASASEQASTKKRTVKKTYTVNKSTQTITVDFERINDADFKFVQTLANSGYTVKKKRKRNPRSNSGFHKRDWYLSRLNEAQQKEFEEQGTFAQSVKWFHQLMKEEQKKKDAEQGKNEATAENN